MKLIYLLLASPSLQNCQVIWAHKEGQFRSIHKFSCFFLLFSFSMRFNLISSIYSLLNLLIQNRHLVVWTPLKVYSLWQQSNTRQWSGHRLLLSRHRMVFRLPVELCSGLFYLVCGWKVQRTACPFLILYVLALEFCGWKYIGPFAKKIKIRGYVEVITKTNFVRKHKGEMFFSEYGSVVRNGNRL